MKTFLSYLHHILSVIEKLTSNAYGILLAGVLNVSAFFAPEKYAFTVVFVAVFIDAFFGTWVSIKTGNFILSKLGRATVLKLTSYASALVLLFMIEKMVHDSGFVGIRVVSAWAAACEFWSISAYVLILWPEATFSKFCANICAAKWRLSSAMILMTYFRKKKS